MSSVTPAMRSARQRLRFLRREAQRQRRILLAIPAGAFKRAALARSVDEIDRLLVGPPNFTRAVLAIRATEEALSAGPSGPRPPLSRWSLVEAQS